MADENESGSPSPTGSGKHEPGSTPSPVTIELANLAASEHREAIQFLTDAYARDPMGLGHPMDPDLLAALPDRLSEMEGAAVFIAWSGGQPVGIATCFKGFSSFKAAPLLNIHDIAVLPERRGAGVGQLLLKAVEAYAREQGYCRVTLEVREDNPAKHVYTKAGFSLGDHPMFFMTKEL